MCVKNSWSSKKHFSVWVGDWGHKDVVDISHSRFPNPCPPAGLSRSSLSVIQHERI